MEYVRLRELSKQCSQQVLCPVSLIITLMKSTAVHSVTLNLANKFSQCTFSIGEHYDLFSGLIILRAV